MAWKTVSQNHFRRIAGGGRSCWSSTTENTDSEVVAESDKGYLLLPKALRKFFAAQQNPDWNPDYTGMQGMPAGYLMKKVSDGDYVVTHFEEMPGEPDQDESAFDPDASEWLNHKMHQSMVPRRLLTGTSAFGGRPTDRRCDTGLPPETCSAQFGQATRR